MRDRWAWLRVEAAAVDDAPDVARGRVLAGLACAIAAANGVRLPELALLGGWGTPSSLRIPDGVAADPWLLGEALEALVDVGDRRRRGVHHTPRSVARAVVGLAFPHRAAGDATVCDPAVGGGAFLLAAADALAATGLPPADVVRRLRGVDVDPLAAAVADASLRLWAGGRSGATIEVADALVRPPGAWDEPTVVVGNPPYLNQMRAATVRRPEALRGDLAALTGPYTDSAALFAVLANDMVAPGGRVVLVLPRSFLVARDAACAREATLRSAVLEHLWWPRERVFGAAVDVCVPVWRRRERTPAAGLAHASSPLARGGWALRSEWLAVASVPSSSGALDTSAASPAPSVTRSTGALHTSAASAAVVAPTTDAPHTSAASPAPPVTRSTGVPPSPAPPACAAVGPARHASWSHLLTGLDGSPAVPSLDGLRCCGVLGDLSTATAGFRDQYYGLIPFVVDDPDGAFGDDTHAPLVTSGLIDPAATTWGRRPTRYAGRRWHAPRVDLAAVESAGGPLGRWVEGKRVPKLLVAAQTRTVEAVVDLDGSWLPSTPVATVVAADGMHWHVLAVLLSPVATAWGLQHHRGAAMSADALRLPPAALRALPTPACAPAWETGARAVAEASLAIDGDARREHLTTAATAMCEAYGLDPAPGTAWWAARLPGTARTSSQHEVRQVEA